jgi:hypothetical protein
MKVGDKVVCVRDDFQNRVVNVKRPKKGQIYTIRDVSEYNGYVGVRLVEIVNPICHYRNGWSECCFDHKAFRPIDYSFGQSVADEIEKELKVEREPVTA